MQALNRPLASWPRALASPSQLLCAPVCARRWRRGPTSRSAAVGEVGTTAAEASQQGLLEINKDNYWEYLKAEEQRGMVIAVDCYTEWCGPCKLIYPELVQMSAEMEPNARIVKFNCNKYNKELGVQLKIKVAPTFLLYRDGEKIGEMTGAKVEKLRALLEAEVKASTILRSDNSGPLASTEGVAMASYSQQPE